MADDAGALLVRSGLVSPSALEDARSRVASEGGTIGEQLVAAGTVSDDQLTEFYRQRLLVPQVNPNTLARLTPKVVAAIPSDMAIELRAIPVSLDGDNNLTVAMSDPSDRHAVDEISFFTGTYVVRAVATQMQIAWCLAHYYGHVTPLGARLIQPQKPLPAGAAAAATATVTATMATAPMPATVATPGAPRAKGATAKVDATRHRAIAPITGPIDPVRPLGSELDAAVAEARALDEKVTETMAAVAPPGGKTAEMAAVAPPGGKTAEMAAVAPSPAAALPLAGKTLKMDAVDPVPSLSGKTAEMPVAAPPTSLSGKTAEMPAAAPPPSLSDETVEMEAEEPTDEVQVLAADEPPDDEEPAATAGAPDRRPARGIAGEPRAPLRQRAASIRPPMPDPHLGDDEDDEPMISIEERTSDDAAGPRMVPVRRRVKSDPPELKARAGEVSLGARQDRTVDDQPRIIIEDDALVPVGPMAGELRAITHRDEPIPTSTIEVEDTSVGIVLADLAGEMSEPVLLERRRTDTPVATVRAPSNEDGLDTTDDEIVVLEARKRPLTPRPEKRTQIGVGAHTALTRHVRGTDPHVPAVSGDDEVTGVDGRPAPSRDDDTDETLAAPPATGGDGDDTNPRLFAPPARVIVRPRAASIRPLGAPPPHATTIDDDDEEDAAPDGEDELAAGPETSVMTAVELDAAIPQRRDQVVPGHLEPGRPEPRRPDSDSLDEAWGPPGTTIPPPLLGAVPGSDEDAVVADGSRIPVSNNTGPLIVALPAPPESTRDQPALAEPSGQSLVRALEEATSRAVQLIHAIERATERDGVVSLMIGHLAESHARAGFFSIRPNPETGKAGELAVFRIEPAPPILPTWTLRLDRPSTLQDVVGTRLPYRGPMHDDASRSFLAGVLGACPPEILLVPVSVRERVVGVLFGEHRLRHTFDDQLALAARAAGMALERILKAKRG